MMRDMPRERKLRLMAVLIAVLLVAGAVAFFLWRDVRRSPVVSGGTGKYDHGADIPVEDFDNRLYENNLFLPVGKLIVTKLRAEYQEGELRLVIPRLELDKTVFADTTEVSLSKGPCLYKYAQIPNIYNTNVSIAGHRDLPPYDFYYLDTVQEGDHMYLVYQGKLFKYLYKSTSEVEKTDWTPIRVHYDSRLTLTTCTPLGTARMRMIVVGELVEIIDYDEAYVFK